MLLLRFLLIQGISSPYTPKQIINGHRIRSKYDTMLLVEAIFPNYSMIFILSTGWMRTNLRTARVVKPSMFLLLFLYVIKTFRISPSLLNSIPLPILYWHVFTLKPSFLMDITTSQIFTSWSMRNHLDAPSILVHVISAMFQTIHWRSSCYPQVLLEDSQLVLNLSLL